MEIQTDNMLNILGMTNNPNRLNRSSMSNIDFSPLPPTIGQINEQIKDQTIDVQTIKHKYIYLTDINSHVHRLPQHVETIEFCTFALTQPNIFSMIHSANSSILVPTSSVPTSLVPLSFSNMSCINLAENKSVKKIVNLVKFTYFNTETAVTEQHLIEINMNDIVWTYLIKTEQIYINCNIYESTYELLRLLMSNADNNSLTIKTNNVLFIALTMLKHNKIKTLQVEPFVRHDSNYATKCYLYYFQLFYNCDMLYDLENYIIKNTIGHFCKFEYLANIQISSIVIDFDKLKEYCDTHSIYYINNIVMDICADNE